MLLHRKPAVRRLHPVGAADARHFVGESALALGIAHVLDHGIAEDDIERAIAEGQRAAVARHPP